MDTAEKAAAKIRSTTGNRQAVAKKLDLSSLQSVREFCRDILKEESRLDIIVNNAGVAGLRRTNLNFCFILFIQNKMFNMFNRKHLNRNCGQ